MSEPDLEDLDDVEFWYELACEAYTSSALGGKRHEDALANIGNAIGLRISAHEAYAEIRAKALAPRQQHVPPTSESK